MADKFTDKQIEQFRATFKLFDKDHDGKISVKDLGLLMDEIGVKPSESNLKDMIGQFDINESGNLDFS